MSTRLLVVEDDPDLREALTDWFRGRGDFEVAATDRAEDAARLHGDNPADAILLDLSLPGVDGLDFLRALRADDDRTPVLVVTARGSEDQRIAGLEHGADDYVVKPFSVRELSLRLDAVLRRSEGARTMTHRIGQVIVDLDARSIQRGAKTHRMLAREAELLAYLMQHRGRAIDRAELLREVWGYDQAPGTRTVDTHIFQLRQKLEADPRHPEHLVTVHRKGYRLR